jgi:hypothetical protein
MVKFEVAGSQLEQQFKVSPKVRQSIFAAVIRCAGRIERMVVFPVRASREWSITKTKTGV